MFAGIGLGSPVLIVWQRLRGFIMKTLNPNNVMATTQIEKRDETRYCQELWIRVIKRRPFPSSSLIVLPFVPLTAHP